MKTTLARMLGVLVVACLLGSVLAIPAAAAQQPTDFRATAADDEIPGVTMLLPFGIRDSLTTSDVDDVVAVWLPEGAHLVVTMASAPGTQFGLALFPPGSTTVADLQYAVAQSAYDAQDPTMSLMAYETPAAGVYYIDFYMRQGSGDGEYAATSTLANWWLTSVKCPSKPKANKRFTISCYVGPSFDTEAATMKFEVQKYSKGHWRKYHTFTADVLSGDETSYCHVHLKGQGTSKLRVRAVFDDGFKKYKTKYKYFKFSR
jgi:hypothetical protein